MRLSERLEAHAAAWPTVYGSDRHNVALIREAAALARRIEDAPVVLASEHIWESVPEGLEGRRVRLVPEVDDGRG
ncbi:hypothetical protein ABE488_00945 [Luteimonas sp. TWI662]|uniref:hypothetical protein n=1 Tax=Luteimonas sp. TWI662 TaxID=3136789 RepID=UPI00320967C6